MKFWERGNEMNEIKIKYVLRHGDTGKICTKIFTLEEIEQGEFYRWFDWFNGYTLITKNPGVEVRGKWYFEGDVLRNPCLSDLWIVRIEKGCFKVGLIPNSGIIKHPGNVQYPYQSELLYDVTDVFDNIGNKWDNPELLGGQDEIL